MKRIVVLLSGQGSNLVALARAAQEENWPARVVAVISNKPAAGGLAWATSQGIAAIAIDHTSYPDRESFDAALAREIDGHSPDLVVLAGFMRILTPAFVQRYEGRMLNIHPSLLPAFTGLHTHRRAIEDGCKLAGATVHFVSADLDHGPVVVQAAVPVLPDDDEKTLAARVLRVEHRIYPLAVRWFVTDRLALEGGRVRQIDGERQVVFAAEA